MLIGYIGRDCEVFKGLNSLDNLTHFGGGCPVLGHSIAATCEVDILKLEVLFTIFIIG